MRRLAAEHDAQGAMTKVTVAPITSTIKGLSSEVLVGPANGLAHDCAISLDNVLTVPLDASDAPWVTSAVTRKRSWRAPWCWRMTSRWPSSNSAATRDCMSVGALVLQGCQVVCGVRTSTTQGRPASRAPCCRTPPRRPAGPVGAEVASVAGVVATVTHEGDARDPVVRRLPQDRRFPRAGRRVTVTDVMPVELLRDRAGRGSRTVGPRHRPIG